MTAIFPAAGGLGGATLKYLLEFTGDPESLILISRSPGKLSAEKERGALTRQADYDTAASFRGVFEGVKTLNLISYASFQNDHRFHVAKIAIDSAISQGVTHIFYSSLAFAGNGDTSVSQVMAAHLRTEAYLRELATSLPSFTFTIIRQGLYSESTPIYTAFFDLNDPKDGVIRIPHDGSGPGLAWAKREELGEATARIIAAYNKNPADFPYINKIIVLSGPGAYSLSETADIFSRVLNKPIRIERVSVDEYVALPQVKQNMDHGQEWGAADWPRLWSTAWEGIRQGEAAYTTGLLAEWLGREPEAFETTIKGLVRN